MRDRFYKRLRDIPVAVDSRLDKHYHIGMRVIKTAVAVMVCLIIALLTGSRNSIPITAVSALVTLQATQGETIRTAVFRVLGTIIGGVLGILAVIIGLFIPYYIEGLFVVIIPLMLLVDLYLCNVLKMQDSCTISCVVTIIVAARVTTDASINEAFIFTLLRLRDTLIGVGLATVINLIPFNFAGLIDKNNAE